MASLGSVKKWDDETDVLVAGYGVAGCAAAIAAHDADPQADVLVVEKMAEAWAGGNGRVSGQSLLISHERRRALPVPEGDERHEPAADDMLREWARQMAALEPYIEARVPRPAPASSRAAAGAEGEAVLRVPRVRRRERGRLQRHRDADPERRLDHDEDLRREAPAHPPTLRVRRSSSWCRIPTRSRCSVRSSEQQRRAPRDPRAPRRRGRDRRLRGRPRHAARLLRPREAYPLGTPANTGDGVRLMQKAGAELWHMRNFGQSGGVWPGFKVPGAATPPSCAPPLADLFSWFEIGADDAASTTRVRRSTTRTTRKSARLVGRHAARAASCRCT
jgi:hypothetical protein